MTLKTGIELTGVPDDKTPLTQDEMGDVTNSVHEHINATVGSSYHISVTDTYVTVHSGRGDDDEPWIDAAFDITVDTTVDEEQFDEWFWSSAYHPDGTITAADRDWDVTGT